MSLKVSTDKFCINQIVNQKNEKILFTGDEIVPDIKPDILKIVSTNGNVCIYKKELLDEKVKLEGAVQVYTTYIADDETNSINSICSNIDFSKTIEIEKVKKDMNLKTAIELESLDCKIINGRKISFDSIINVYICVNSNEEINIINNTDDINDIQKLEKRYSVDTVIGSKTTKAFAKNTININEEDNLKDIISVKLDVNNNENKINYNKVLTKADVNVKIVYLTEDNRINSVKSVIPIMGFLDIENVSEEDKCETFYELRNILLKPNNVEEHSIYFEAEYEVSVDISSSREMEVLEDLYSPSIMLDYNKQNIKLVKDSTNIEQTFNYRRQENLSELGKIKISDIQVKTKLLNTQIDNKKITYEGEIELNILYEDQNIRMINSKTIIEPFSYTISDDNLMANTNVQTEVNIKNQDFIIMSDDSLDIKIDITFSLVITNITNINVITSIDEKEGEQVNRYSMSIYYIKPGDTLWNIAKQFGSTVELIKEINNIEDENVIMPGEQLFIPR